MQGAIREITVNRLYYTVPDVLKALDVSRPTAYKLIHNTYPIGRISKKAFNQRYML